MKEKKEYKAPTLVSVTFKMERGFAESQKYFTTIYDNELPEEMENYTTANDWTSGSNTFWN